MKIKQRIRKVTTSRLAMVMAAMILSVYANAQTNKVDLDSGIRAFEAATNYLITVFIWGLAIFVTIIITCFIYKRIKNIYKQIKKKEEDFKKISMIVAGECILLAASVKVLILLLRFILYSL